MNRTPDIEAMLQWLTREAVDADGAVWSWRSTQSVGYRYPEAAALLLSVLSVEQPERFVEPRARIARRLAREGGPIGRESVLYTFDTAIALRAFELHAGPCDTDAEVGRMRTFLREQLEARRATNVPMPERWSTVFGAHLLKACMVSRDVPVGQLKELCTDEGRFRVSLTDARTYLHAHCYALEGLIWLGERALVERGAAWLARVQGSSGELRAWHDGAVASGPPRADVVAQAVRIWSLVDPIRHREAIARALGHLAELQHPSGGLRYEPGSDDVNTWATAFAVQAVRFAAGSADARTLF